MKTLLFVLTVLSLTACAQRGVHLSDSKTTWINLGNGTYSTPYWCSAEDPNKPICKKAEVEDLLKKK